MSVRKKLLMAFGIAIGLLVAQMAAVEVSIRRLQVAVETITDIAAAQHIIRLSNDIVGSLDLLGMVCQAATDPRRGFRLRQARHKLPPPRSRCRRRRIRRSRQSVQ